jgi:hypothetical protein
VKILCLFRALFCSSSGGLRRNCIYAASGIVIASFIIPDGHIVFMQFYFDLFVLLYPSCLFSIANLDDWLTVHCSITLVDLQTIPEAAYIQLRRRPPEDEQGNARNMSMILINVLYVNK